MPPERGCAYALEGNYYPRDYHRRSPLGALHKNNRLDSHI